MKPHLKFEKKLWEKNLLVAGIDEVGRGCFAGPLTAAGIILKPNLSKKEVSKLLSLGINDSKLVSKKNREKIIKSAQKYILYSQVQYISVSYINRFGVGMANKLAFSKIALTMNRELKTKNLFYLTDCFPIPKIEDSSQKNIIRGDQTSISIALASIMAKVNRDSYMEKLGVKFPEYNFQSNKGYGTKFHREVIKTSGITPHHRIQFVARFV